MDCEMNWTSDSEQLCVEQCLVCFMVSLSSTKQRLIVRSGCKFTNPVLLYEQLKSVGRSTSQQRYASKVLSEFAMYFAKQMTYSVLSGTLKPTVPYLYFVPMQFVGLLGQCIHIIHICKLWCHYVLHIYFLCQWHNVCSLTVADVFQETTRYLTVAPCNHKYIL